MWIIKLLLILLIISSCKFERKSDDQSKVVSVEKSMQLEFDIESQISEVLPEGKNPVGLFVSETDKGNKIQYTFCTSVLILNKYALTNSHCIHDLDGKEMLPQQIKIMFKNLSEDKGTFWEVNRIVDSKKEGLQDWALLELKNPDAFEKYGSFELSDFSFNNESSSLQATAYVMDPPIFDQSSHKAIAHLEKVAVKYYTDLNSNLNNLDGFCSQTTENKFEQGNSGSPIILDGKIFGLFYSIANVAGSPFPECQTGDAVSTWMLYKIFKDN